MISTFLHFFELLCLFFYDLLIAIDSDEKYFDLIHLINKRYQQNIFVSACRLIAPELRIIKNIVENLAAKNNKRKRKVNTMTTK